MFVLIGIIVVAKRVLAVLEGKVLLVVTVKVLQFILEFELLPRREILVKLMVLLHGCDYVVI